MAARFLQSIQAPIHLNWWYTATGFPCIVAGCAFHVLIVSMAMSSNSDLKGRCGMIRSGLPWASKTVPCLGLGSSSNGTAKFHFTASLASPRRRRLSLKSGASEGDTSPAMSSFAPSLSAAQKATNTSGETPVQREAHGPSAENSWVEPYSVRQ